MGGHQALDIKQAYLNVQKFYDICIVGNDIADKAVDTSQASGNYLWLMGAGDSYIELGILEDMMLDAMEGLA